MTSPCVWQEMEDVDSGVWLSECGRNPPLQHGTPRHNSMRFCSYCGGEIVERRFSEFMDEDTP